MLIRDTEKQYGMVTRWLHGAIAVLFVLQLFIGVIHEDISNEVLHSGLMQLHKSLGLILLGLTVCFLFWRAISKKPAFPASMREWERSAARLNHAILFASLLVMSISGWIMSTASGRPPYFLWLFSAPLPGVSQNDLVAHALSIVHYFTAWVVSAAVVAHILASIWHHFIRKDNVLRRMWRSGS